MNDWRTKIAVLAVVLGLGGLGGYAMSSSRKVHQATTAAVPTTQVIRRTVHEKPKHQPSAGSDPGARGAQPDQRTRVDGIQRRLTSSPPVSTGTSGSAAVAARFAPAPAAQAVEARAATAAASTRAATVASD